MTNTNQDTINLEQLPFILNRKDSYLEFYPKTESNPEPQSNEEPTFRMYLWDKEEVNRLYQMRLHNVELTIEDTPSGVAKFFNSIWAAIYRKLII